MVSPLEKAVNYPPDEAVTPGGRTVQDKPANSQVAKWKEKLISERSAVICRTFFKKIQKASVFLCSSVKKDLISFRGKTVRTSECGRNRQNGLSKPPQ